MFVLCSCGKNLVQFGKEPGTDSDVSKGVKEAVSNQFQEAAPQPGGLARADRG